MQLGCTSHVNRIYRLFKCIHTHHIYIYYTYIRICVISNCQIRRQEAKGFQLSSPCRQPEEHQSSSRTLPLSISCQDPVAHHPRHGPLDLKWQGLCGGFNSSPGDSKNTLNPRKLEVVSIAHFAPTIFDTRNSRELSPHWISIIDDENTQDSNLTLLVGVKCNSATKCNRVQPSATECNPDFRLIPASSNPLTKVPHKTARGAAALDKPGTSTSLFCSSTVPRHHLQLILSGL